VSEKAVQKWADEAMFKAEESVPEPKVYLLQGTPDPLGSIAAFAAMYTGKVVRNKLDVTDDERRHYLTEMQKTHLKAPLEAVNLHFMIEGVTRSFTHQIVRQRTAVYAQESLRFAVKEDAATAVALPPSLAGTLGEDDDPEEGMGWTTSEQEARVIWDEAVDHMADAYNSLIEAGMPAEDARGLLPHAITTRLNYHTNLRSLGDHAGVRLCTQAQFEWRVVWGQIKQALREYCTSPYHQEMAHKGKNAEGLRTSHDMGHFCDNWQWRAIADLFQPICYTMGSCQFKAEFDRKCSIRSRVEANAQVGRPSTEWHEEMDKVEGNPIVAGVGTRTVVRTEAGQPVFIGAIEPREWLADPAAAR